MAVITPRSPMDLSRKKAGRNDTVSTYAFDAPATIVRQALFPSGPGSYPSQESPLDVPPESGRYPSMRRQMENETLHNEHKWREMGWSTSFPAEYMLQRKTESWKRTLAHSKQKQNPVDTSTETVSIMSPTKGNMSRSLMDATTAELDATQSEEERMLLKYTMLRECLLTGLFDLLKTATPAQSSLQVSNEIGFDVAKGTEVLHILLQLRDAGVLVVESILRWHELRAHLTPTVGLAPFRFENHNYCVKMLSDLNFLSGIQQLGAILGVNPLSMNHNPFMMPTPIPERNFHALRDLPWQSLRLFISEKDSVKRVEDAETYLVWCLFNLQDRAPSTAHVPCGTNSPASYPMRDKQPQKMVWQKRAEKQLELLSMPLEAISGSTHLQDSSKMMKRKGMLPSLPQSPSKTLRELMNNVQQSGSTYDDHERGDNNYSQLRAHWNAQEFTAGAPDFESLGALDVPPHSMVTLVAASVLILLSPADQLPKDLSWQSCRKMFRHGKRLIDRMQGFDVTGVPVFKLKALEPFLQHEHYQPHFMGKFSRAAKTMCAWVLSALDKTKQQDVNLDSFQGSDEDGDDDRLVLLAELEVDAAESLQSSKSRPTSCPRREKNSVLRPLSNVGKRMTIGNAEVLFLDDELPVTSMSRGSLRSSSRLGESSVVSNNESKFIVNDSHTRGASNALLRTSPWTFRGVVYFVSFFLLQDNQHSQQQDEVAKSREQRRLVIKIYEPMSSVESQISVDTEDLRQDFGEQALLAFQNGQYNTLCDHMLRQLDQMVGAQNTIGTTQFQR